MSDVNAAGQDIAEFYDHQVITTSWQSGSLGMGTFEIFIPDRRLSLVFFANLFFSLPADVLARWAADLRQLPEGERKAAITRRIQGYLDCGYGEAYLERPEVGIGMGNRDAPVV